jgi:hypothetical protein
MRVGQTLVPIRASTKPTGTRNLVHTTNVMKVIALGIGRYPAERAGVEVVYYIGCTLLVIAGLTGIVARRDERLREPAPTPNS